MSNDLETLLHQETHPPTSPDLALIHRRGSARRRRSRYGAMAAVLVVGLVAGGAWSLAGSGDDARTIPAVSQSHRATGLTAYERSVLREIPSAYSVDGTVVLPDTAHAGQELRERNGPAKRLLGTAVPLGFDGRAGPGYIPTAKTQEPYLENAPRGSQVVVDPGPVLLGCVATRGSGCAPVVLATADDGSHYYLNGIGTDDFLEPGAPMELFLDDDYSGRTRHTSLIGGIDGTDITRVVVDLVDGSTAEATVNTGRLSPGNTLFYARLAAEPRQVKAYDAKGDLVATHAVKKCSGGVDCEVR